MAEEQKNQEPLKTFVGIFTGKEARRKFKTKEGVEGICYGIKLKQDTSQQFGKSFTIYSNTKGLDKVQELDKVKVGYRIDTFVTKKGENAKANKIMWISKTEEPVTTKENQQEEIQESPETPAFKIVEWERFKESYDEVTKDSPNRGIAHMAGNYIFTYWDNIKEINELRALCSKAITPELKQ
jgi:hypothetical protein